MTNERMRVPVKYGFVSCVGFFTESYPARIGNYFSINHDGKDIRILNFWYENLKEAKKLFLLDGMVEMVVYRDGNKMWAVIDEDRIPGDWYSSLYFVGANVPKEIQDLLSKSP